MPIDEAEGKVGSESEDASEGTLEEGRVKLADGPAESEDNWSEERLREGWEIPENELSRIDGTPKVDARVGSDGALDCW